jgi:CHAD domain-containing protein
MSFDVERIDKSSRRVKKFFRKNPKRPGQAAIHHLRTSIRTLETTFTTVGFDSHAKVRRLLRDLRDTRKSAGKVRDMDVLTADVLALSNDDETDCLVQLLEYLGAERNKYAKKLRRVIRTTDSHFQRNFKRSLKRLKKHLRQAPNNHDANSDTVPLAMARAIELSSRLRVPAKLNRNNLHPYRLQIKELREVLQLSEKAGDEEFVQKLGEVKDAIGEWHDWEELTAIATQLLDHGPSCEVIKHLDENRNAKFERALAITDHFRDKYLKSTTARRGHRRSKSPLSGPVLRATSAIAEA